jgi:hypothetical protein
MIILDISSNEIGAEGAKHMAEAIKVSSVVVVLWCSGPSENG